MEENKILTFILHKKAIFTSIIFTFISLCGLLGSSAIIIFENKISHFFTQEVQIDKENRIFRTENPVNMPECTINMNIPLRSDGLLNCWQQADSTWGAQYDIYIYNNTAKKIQNWVLSLTVPENAKIDSCWNGFYTTKNGTIKITPSRVALNEEVSPKTFCKLGFVLYTDELLTESSFSLETKLVEPLLGNKKFISFTILTILGFIFLVLSVINYKIVKKQQQQAEKEISEILKLCARFIDTRDKYTQRHSLNVAKYSKLLAEELGYSKSFQKNIYNCGILHDVGKVFISRSILCKTSKLNEEEWAEMKKHTVYGAESLKDFKEIENVTKVALYHHERFDGKGYMEGLKGEEIPLEARIVCVADSFDAMATDRAYRPHLPKNIIISELEKGKGTQFDPKIAQAMLNLISTGKIKI